jgi:hypothetical protein
VETTSLAHERPPSKTPFRRIRRILVLLIQLIQIFNVATNKFDLSPTELALAGRLPTKFSEVVFRIVEICAFTQFRVHHLRGVRLVAKLAGLVQRQIEAGDGIFTLLLKI